MLILAYGMDKNKGNVRCSCFRTWWFIIWWLVVSNINIIVLCCNINAIL